MKVADLMQQRVRIVTANTSAADVIRSLVEAHLSALSVLDQSERPA